MSVSLYKGQHRAESLVGSPSARAARKSAALRKRFVLAGPAYRAGRVGAARGWYVAKHAVTGSVSKRIIPAPEIVL